MRGFFRPDSWDRKGVHVERLPRCGRCGLSTKCINPKMKHTGRGDRKILFIAEAPGEREDRKGIQLIGDAGKLHRRVLHGQGEELDCCWKTNAVICRPPGNEIKDTYIEACRPNVLKTIRELKPKVIVLLGASAVKSVIGPEWGRDIGRLSRWIGHTIPSPQHKAWLIPTYHPSYLRRMSEDAVLMGSYNAHIAAAFALERGPCAPILSVDTMQQEVETLTRIRDVRLRLRDLSQKEGQLAFDYETTGLKPDSPEQHIVSVSFCLEGEETWAGMIDSSCHRALSRVLLNRRLRKIASNLKFEDRWTRTKLGHPVRGWLWDTMLAAHVLDNRSGVTSIKFQAYVLLGIGEYEKRVAPFLRSKQSNGLNRIHEVDPETLLIYNGMDSKLEWMVAQLQMTKFKEANRDSPRA